MKGLTGRVRPSWSPCLKWKAHSVSRWPDPRLTWPMSFFDDTEWSSRGNIPFNRQNTLLIIDLPTLTLVFGCYLVSYFQVLGRRYISKNRYSRYFSGQWQYQVRPIDLVFLRKKHHEEDHWVCHMNHLFIWMFPKIVGFSPKSSMD